MKIIVFIYLCFLSTSIFAQASQYGPTQAKDSLWAIAGQYKTESQSRYQLLYAFYKKNKHAFYENNMNRLKQGVYLTVPESHEIEQVNFELSTKEVDKQIGEYEVFYKEYEREYPPQDQLAVKTQPKVPVVPPVVEKPTVSLPEIAMIKKSLQIEQQKRKKPSRILYKYDVSVAYDDNVRLAQYDRDIRSDVVGTFIFKALTNFKTSELSRLRLGVSFEHENFKTFDKLNHLTYSVDTTYSFVTNTSFSAPLYNVKLSLGGIESDSEMRSSDILKLGFESNIQITDKIHLTAGVGLKKRESQSDVFDTEQTSFFLNTDFSLNRKELIYTTFHYIKGEKVSSATPSLGIIGAANFIEPDDAFGGVGLNQFAYQVDTESFVFTLGYNKAISRKLSFDVSARFVDSESIEDSGIYYKRMIYRAGLLGRF